MAKEIVGIKIGASGLAAARLSVNGSAQLLQVASEPLEPGLVASGELREPEALVLPLKAFFKQHKLPRRAVRVGIANNRIGVRTIELAGIDDPRQLANAIRFRAQEVLPIPLDQAVLDYQVLSETTDDEGQPKKRVLLVVAYRDLIEAYITAFREAGVRLVGIDLEAFALLRALTPPEPPAPGVERSALVAVALGAERSILAVSDGFACEFTRVLDWGGSELTASLASALGLGEDEAEALKRRISVSEDAFIADLDVDQAAKAQEALRTALGGFARELVSSLQFYQSQPDSLGIGEVVLAGGGARLGGLAEALAKLIGVRVRIGDPLVGVKRGKKLKEEPDPSFAVPIGLGMGS